MRLQDRNLPLYDSNLNDIESLSLFVSLVTVFCGIWYLTGENGNEIEVILFAIIIIANLVFIVTWIIYYVGSAKWS